MTFSASSTPPLTGLKPNSRAMEIHGVSNQAAIGAEKRDSLRENRFGSIPMDWIAG